MKKQRLDRIDSLLKEVIVEVILKEVQNPHIHSLITVTKVTTSPDLRHAKVLVSLMGSPKENTETLEALRSAAGFIAIAASKKVQIRYFPKLQFYQDTSLDDHFRIENLLSKLEKERNQRAPGSEA